MKPAPCFEANTRLEEAASDAEARKNRAIERLNSKLDAPTAKDAFVRAMEGLIDADVRALQERGK